MGAYWTDWTIQPEIAHTWEISDNGRRYVFHLRDDVVWTDGEPVTAHDFEFAWKRILDPQTGSRVAERLYAIQGAQAYHRGETIDPDSVAVRAVDPRRLAVELEGPTGYFLHLLTSPPMVSVPRHVVERYGKAWIEPDHLVTNGPFCLQDWKVGESITLLRNPAYFGRFRGNLSEVTFISPHGVSPRDKLAAYRAGRVDSLNLTPEIYHARQQHAAEYHHAKPLETRFLGFGLVESPFRDRRVRQAVGLAIDREELANQVLNGQGIPATGGLLPPGFPGHSPDIGLPYDPERARRLLAEAGYPDGKDFPPVELLSSGEFFHGIDQALQRFWAEQLGIQVKLKTMAWAEFLEHQRQSPLFLVGWSPDYPDPDYFLRAGVRSLASFWRHMGYERLIQAATRSTDQVERLRLYQQADRILMEKAAIVPTVYPADHSLVKPWLKNIVGNEYLLKNVIIEPH
jgi:oligopeptide transport system substrate-binding protein